MFYSWSRVALWMLASILGLLMVLATLAQAGWVEDLPDKAVIHLKIWQMPDPSSPAVLVSRAYEVLRE